MTTLTCTIVRNVNKPDCSLIGEHITLQQLSFQERELVFVLVCTKDGADDVSWYPLTVGPRLFDHDVSKELHDLYNRLVFSKVLRLN